MTCEYCGCDCPCGGSEDKAAELRWQAKLAAWVESVNWNCTPAEVAQDIKQRGWNLDECIGAMRRRKIPSNQLETVRDAYEVFC